MADPKAGRGTLEPNCLTRPTDKRPIGRDPIVDQECFMRLHPAVHEEEVLEWLRLEALNRWGKIAQKLDSDLITLAGAMAAISAVELPEEVEPGPP